MSDSTPAPQKPLKITEISYGKTLNIGEFESIHLRLTADVNADEDWKEVLQRLRVTIAKLEPRLREDRR